MKHPALFSQIKVKKIQVSSAAIFFFRALRGKPRSRLRMTSLLVGH